MEKEKATHSGIMDWRIPWTTVHGVVKSLTQLSDFHSTFTFYEAVDLSSSFKSSITYIHHFACFWNSPMLMCIPRMYLFFSLISLFYVILVIQPDKRNRRRRGEILTF